MTTARAILMEYVRPTEEVIAQLHATQEMDMSFKSKWDSAFAKLFHTAPNWIHFAQTMLPFAATTAMAVMAVADPVALPVLMPIMNEVQADLATVSVLAGDGSVTPSLTDALQRVQDNLSAIITAEHIKDPKVTSAIGIVVSEAKQLAEMLPQQAPAQQQ